MKSPNRHEPSERVVLSVGSNLGDRMGNLRFGLEELSQHGQLVAVSSVYETPPQGYADQPDFLNLASVLTTDVSPMELLSIVNEVEHRCGRRREFKNGPRQLDIDIIFWGDRIIDQPGLTVPHPRWTERSFVLAPLLELGPSLGASELETSIEEHWAALLQDGPPAMERVADPIRSKTDLKTKPGEE